jgi:hypothetical protein
VLPDGVEGFQVRALTITAFKEYLKEIKFPIDINDYIPKEPVIRNTIGDILKDNSLAKQLDYKPTAVPLLKMPTLNVTVVDVDLRESNLGKRKSYLGSRDAESHIPTKRLKNEGRDVIKAEDLKDKKHTKSNESMKGPSDENEEKKDEKNPKKITKE